MHITEGLTDLPREAMTKFSGSADPENLVRRNLTTIFISHQCISQRALRTSLEKPFDHCGPMASRGVCVCGGGGGSVLEFLKLLVIFPDGSGPCAPLWIRPIIHCLARTLRLLKTLCNLFFRLRFICMVKIIHHGYVPKCSTECRLYR